MSDNDSLLPFGRQITTHSDVQEYIFHLQGKPGYENVSEKVKEQSTRWIQCKDWIRKHKVKPKVIPMLMTEYNISERTAYRIYDETLDVYNVFSEPKGRDLKVEILEEEYWTLYRKCVADSSWKAAESCLRRIKEIYLEFYGDADAKQYRNLQPPVWMFGFFTELSNVQVPEDLPEQVEKLLKEKKKKSLSFDEFVDDDIKDENDTNSSDE